MGALAPFFMAITITTIHPPAVKSPIPIDWQAAQAADPLAEQPIATLAAGLKTGTVNAPGTSSNPPLYTIDGVNGLSEAGGGAINGVLFAGPLAAGMPLTVVANGTSGATNKTAVATTGGLGTGLTVNLVASGGVVVGATVANPGTMPYRLGDVVTVAMATAGTTANVTLRIF